MKTVSPPFETFMNARNAKEDCIPGISSYPDAALATLTQNKTATIGRPFLVQYAKILGA